MTKNLNKRIYTSVFLIVLSLLMLKYSPVLLFTLIVIGIFSIIEFSLLIKKVFKRNFSIFIVNLIFILYVFIFCSLFFIFSIFFQIKILLFSLLFCCVASDLGGFIFGKILNGPKLTKISPNKTIYGSIGSIILSSITLYFIFYFIAFKTDIKILIVAITTSIFSQLGDLFFSYFKRRAKVKDTGNFLPGHGGFLDRVDGMLLGIPAGFIIFSLIFN